MTSVTAESMRPGFELALEVHATLDPTLTLGQTPHGQRRVVPITGGEFAGPRIRGSVVPGGADWQLVRADGVNELEARYLLCTDDGVLVAVRNRGIRHGPPAVLDRIAAGEEVDPAEYYFRSVPTFSAPEGRYDWLNRSVFVCTGARYGTAIRLWMWRVT